MDWSSLIGVLASIPIPVIIGIIICFKRADRVKEEVSGELTKLKERVAYLEGITGVKLHQ